MSLTGVENDKKFFGNARRGAPARAPLRTIAELADEFGVTVSSLRGMLAKSTDNPPKPEIKHSRTSSNGIRAYYNRKEVKEWWDRRK